MRLEPIIDRDGDAIAERETFERLLERGDSPTTHLDLGPHRACETCGRLAREVEFGHWACPCELGGLA